MAEAEGANVKIQNSSSGSKAILRIKRKRSADPADILCKCSLFASSTLCDKLMKFLNDKPIEWMYFLKYFLYFSAQQKLNVDEIRI